jgi:S-adenosylmethionine:tRNA ribosyltransferase-isomerase
VHPGFPSASRERGKGQADSRADYGIFALPAKAISPRERTRWGKFPTVEETLRDYEFSLPRQLIAQRPLPRRDESRLMVLRRDAESIEHARFADLPRFVRENDLLVLNDSRVLPARHFSDDGALEFLFVEKISACRWRALVKPGRRFREGAVTTIRGIRAEAGASDEAGAREIVLAEDIDLQRGGLMPLPPYINRAAEGEDEARYQTVFARADGSIAAPTAGLHFTPAMLRTLPHAFVTLHVGPGTFRPVKTENIALHTIHEEQFSVSRAGADAINAANRVIAVGTTTVRVLESLHRRLGEIREGTGATNIFIRPPFQFAIVQALLTNFHLPRSTLLMLVSAFAGREFILRAYAEAVRERYRFFSYGDCMLIL